MVILGTSRKNPGKLPFSGPDPENVKKCLFSVTRELFKIFCVDCYIMRDILKNFNFRFSICGGLLGCLAEGGGFKWTPKSQKFVSATFSDALGEFLRLCGIFWDVMVKGTWFFGNLFCMKIFSWVYLSKRCRASWGRYTPTCLCTVVMKREYFIPLWAKWNI